MEVWKVIPNTKGYYVSNHGNIKRKGKILKQTLTPTGYCTVHVTRSDGTRYTPRVHRLVCKLFKYNPMNKPYVNHLDGIKTNNHIHNLEWCTPKENTDHAVANNLHCYGSKMGGSKLNELDVIKIRQLLSAGECPLIIATQYQVTRRNIYDIKNRKTWRHV